MSANRIGSTIALLALALSGCGDDQDGGEPTPTGPCAPAIGEAAIVITGCSQGSLTLRPRIQLDGVWHGGGDDGPCVAEQNLVRCPAGAAGEVRAELTDGKITLIFSASSTTTVNAFALRGDAEIPGARAWLSNGFQSWSQSGALALGQPANDAALAAALSQRGDPEVVREGSELSWSYSVIGGGLSHLLAGALSAQRFKPWVRAWDAGGGRVGIEVACGGSGEAVGLTGGETLASESFWLEQDSDSSALLERYSQGLASRHRERPAPAEAGWNSWYELWDSVSEQDVRENATLAKESLAPWLAADAKLRIVIDDGWQLMWGEWQPNTKFPSGLQGLGSDLKAQGFEIGVWLAPLLVDEDSALVVDHPDWFVKDAVYEHLKNGNMRVLDVTHPAAADHLKQVVTTIVGWGFNLLKIDFLFAGAWEGGRYESVTGMQAYARALSLIREAAGDGVILLAVGAPDIASLPYADAWRVGGDIALEFTDASWVYLPNQARSVAARVPFCLATLCDADPLIQRALEREEVETGGWVVAFAGGALFLSDDQRLLPSERRSYGLDAERVALSLGGKPAMPIDFLPEGAPAKLPSAIFDQLVSKKSSTHVVPTIWRLPDGKRVGLNVRDEAVEIDGVSVPPRAVRPLD